MAAKKSVAAQSGIGSELSDIPLSLDQGDNDISASQAHKAKTNSLKRFFRKSRRSDDAEVTPKETVSLQLRFGTFHKNDGIKNTANDGASGSPKSIESESRLNLHERLSSYWNNVFKRAPTKIPSSVSARADVATPAAVPPIEEN